MIAEVCRRYPGWLTNLFTYGSLIPLLFVVGATLAAREMSHVLRHIGSEPYHRLAHVAIVLLVAAPWLSAAGWLGRRPEAVEGLQWQIVGLIFVGLGACLVTVARGEPAGSTRRIAATLLMVLYLGFFASFGLQIRCGRHVPIGEGPKILLITILLVKSSDIGGYLVGTFYGRHKLVPSISPAKSVEGLVGGLLLSAVVACIFVILPWSGAFAGSDGASGMGLIGALVFGTVVSAAGQVGDFIESCFKRDAGLKDSGRLIPQFGGILDLIDSPLVALPVAWFLLAVVWNMV